MWRRVDEQNAVTLHYSRLEGVGTAGIDGCRTVSNLERYRKLPTFGPDFLQVDRSRGGIRAGNVGQFHPDQCIRRKYDPHPGGHEPRQYGSSASPPLRWGLCVMGSATGHRHQEKRRSGEDPPPAFPWRHIASLPGESRDRFEASAFRATVYFRCWRTSTQRRAAAESGLSFRTSVK